MEAVEIRSKMKELWTVETTDASIEDMMNDSEASILSKLEQPEIMSVLPPLEGKDVLELGAGIGRFTTKLAQQAKSVMAVDFIERLITKNKETHKEFNNIEYLTKDVTELQLKQNSYDLIFNNWILMYLSDKESAELLHRCLEWLKEDGYIFVRESCSIPGGNKRFKVPNPSIYRSRGSYDQMINALQIRTGGGVWGFKILLSKPLDSYIKVKKSEHQIVWLLQKIQLV